MALNACDSVMFDDQIREAVRAKLKDPDSAKFGDSVTQNDLACIYVNAKNSYGGYTGTKVAQLRRFGGTWMVNEMTDGSCSKWELEIIQKDSELQKKEAEKNAISKKCQDNAVNEDYSICMKRQELK